MTWHNSGPESREFVGANVSQTGEQKLWGLRRASKVLGHEVGILDRVILPVPSHNNATRLTDGTMEKAFMKELQFVFFFYPYCAFLPKPKTNLENRAITSGIQHSWLLNWIRIESLYEGRHQKLQCFASPNCFFFVEKSYWGLLVSARKLNRLNKDLH